MALSVLESSSGCVKKTASFVGFGLSTVTGIDDVVVNVAVVDDVGSNVATVDDFGSVAAAAAAAAGEATADAMGS